MMRRRCIMNYQLQKAYEYICAGNALYKAMKKFRISTFRLRRYCKKQKNIKEQRQKKDFTDKVFSSEQDSEITEILSKCESLFYGLSERECGILVYQIALIYNVKMPDTWVEKRSSDLEWLFRFKKRHPNLTFQSPMRCVRNWHTVLSQKKIVEKFYDDLENNVLNLQCRDGSRIFCLGETYSNIKPKVKSLPIRDGCKDLITTCCFVSATGSVLPPVNIYPSSNFEENILIYPPGVLSIIAPQGKMSMNSFSEVMEHFINHSNTSPENPSILIMDIHINHLSLEALILAKKSGVYLVTVHSHSVKRLMPLKVGIIDLFHKLRNAGIKSWREDNIHNNSGVVFDIGKIIGEAYVKAMSPEIIRCAFQQCGIFPFDRDLFSDEDFKSDLKFLPCADCKLRSKMGSLFYNNSMKSEGKDQKCLSEVQENQHGTNIENVENVKGPPRDRKGKMPPKGAGVELDKLKRRMIRTVARLMKEKKTEDEVWEELQKESGTNCKKLWERMRSLTLKKLKRLQDADDLVDNVPVVARMSLTDWLLYDMVIVHENVDPAAEESLMSSVVLVKLFSLVQMFRIEGRTGNDLAEAWTSATLYYNSKGYQCSPMMMQRRWYLLKKAARENFYNFWYKYRGNNRLLPEATRTAPNKLQQAVALRYPDIVTRSFPEWQDRIEQRLVIMPPEFEDKLRSMQGRKLKKDETIPDVVLVEPQIEIICVEDTDSESEGETNKDAEKTDVPEETEKVNEESQIPIIVQVKTEPEDDIPTYEAESNKPNDFSDEIERLQNEENRIADDELISELVETPAIVKNEMGLISNVMGTDAIVENYSIPSTEINPTDVENFDNNLQESILLDDDDDEDMPSEAVSQSDGDYDEIDVVPNENDSVVPAIENNDVSDININKDDCLTPVIQTDDQICISTNEVDLAPAVESTVSSDTFQEGMLPVISAITSGDQAKIKTEVNRAIAADVTSEDEQNIIMLDKEYSGDEYIQPEKEQLSLEKVPLDINFEDDGIEFVDDGIEYVEEDQHGETDSQATENDTTDNQTSPKFDLKLLMEPVVYTTKLDDMKVYMDRLLYETIEEKDLIDKIIYESKPVSSKSINVDIVKDIPLDAPEEKQTDDLLQLDSSDDSDSEVIEESMKVKLSSHLLQKPRNRSYNPIQLCKNPDFNTRLKRLNVGFFSSSRNRVFLKTCKPMTIDLSKAFESKLVNGTMYLKEVKQGVQIQVERETESNVSSSSIMPSAVAVQSLMNNTVVDKILQEELKKRMLERNKVISLPSISVVRQINDQLQKAEVAPIMAQMNEDIVETNIIDSPKTNDTPHNDDAVIIANNEPKNLVNSIESPTLYINEQTKQTENSLADTINTIQNVVNDKTNDMEGCASPLQSTPNIDEPTVPVIGDITKPKRKAKKKKIKYPSWLCSRLNLPSASNNETLLTIDTLYKMLTALDPECIQKLENAKKQVHNEQLSKLKKNVKASSAVKDVPVTPTVVVKPQNKDNSCPKTKVKALRWRRCCWARHKIDKQNGLIKSFLRHICAPNDCKCCCKEDLKTLTSKPVSKQVEAAHVIAAPVPKVRINFDSKVGANDNIATVKNNMPTDVETNPIATDDSQGCALSQDQPFAELTQTRVFSGSSIAHTSTQSKSKNIEPLNVTSSTFSNLTNLTGPKVAVPCSCRTNVSVDQNQRTFLIDGSHECMQHVRPKPKHRTKEARIYLNRKDINLTERPYYLGKNKILLTNMKKPKTPISDTTSLVLPTGVQVLLLPDGTVTYNITDPNVNLTPTQLAAMPIILNAIKDQIQAAGITLPVANVPPLVNSEIIDLDDESASFPTENVNEVNDANGDLLETIPTSDLTEEQTNAVDNVLKPTELTSDVNEDSKVNGEQNQSPVKELLNPPEKSTFVTTSYIVNTLQNDLKDNVSNDDNAEVHKALDVGSNAPSSEESLTNAENTVIEPPQKLSEMDLNRNESLEKTDTSNCYPIEEGLLTNEPVTSSESESNTVSAGTSRNLLSDLMEMSGILEEDIAPVPEEPTLPAPNEEIVQEPIIQTTLPLNPSSAVLQSLVPVPSLSPISQSKPFTNKPIDQTIQELNPVTSFADLKYSCENGGLFFRLDLITGTIIPIDVSIQKTCIDPDLAKERTSDVIDLTDEPGINISEPTTPPDKGSLIKRTPNLLRSRRLPRNNFTVKNSDQNVQILNRLPNNLKPLKILQAMKQHSKFMLGRNIRKQTLIDDRRFPLKRAQNLNKIEAKIDLVDSDAPMEEEYLVDHSSDDSSDDEPLAKIARKMRATEDVQSVANIKPENNSESQCMPMESEELTDDDTLPQVHIDNNEPRPTQLVLSGKAVNEPIFMNSFITQEDADDEDSQGDCILGV